MRNKDILISGAGIAWPTLAYWLGRYGFTPTREMGFAPFAKLVMERSLVDRVSLPDYEVRQA